MTEALQFVRGDTIRFTISCTRPDLDGVQQPIDLTGASLWCTVKAKVTDDDDDAFIQVESPFSGDSGINILDQTTYRGQAQVIIEAGETEDAVRGKQYHFDVQVLEQDGTLSTPSRGTMQFLDDFTLATA